MKKLDRYIISKYFSSFFFCIILLTAIVVVIDISEKTEDFVKSGLSAWQIITDYYFGFIPRIDAMLFPLFVFIAVIFFTSKMAGRSEIIAILSSGVSYPRFLRPYFIGGLILSAMLWAGYQYVVPNANRKWADFEKNYIDIHSKKPDDHEKVYKRNVYFKLDPNTYVGIKTYDTSTKSGSNFTITRFKDNQLVYNLRAMSFIWDTAKRKWSFSNVLERDLFAMNEKVKFTHKQVLNYNFKPVDLRKDEYLKDQMTTSDLNAYIRLERMRGSETLSTLLVERYNRDAIPFSVLILTIIGAVLASRKVRGGSGVHLAVGLIISFVYILFSRFSVVFATKGDFNPLLAAWLPNLLFGALAFYLYRKAPK